MKTYDMWYDDPEVEWKEFLKIKMWSILTKLSVYIHAHTNFTLIGFYT